MSSGTSLSASSEAGAVGATTTCRRHIAAVAAIAAYGFMGRDKSGIEQAVAEGGDARTYMITGRDENGDHEIFVTADRARADARLKAMRERLKDVRCNDAWDAE